MKNVWKLTFVDVDGCTVSSNEMVVTSTAEEAITLCRMKVGNKVVLYSVDMVGTLTIGEDVGSGTVAA
jgi:hypothetical protein